MRAMSLALRHELVGLSGVIERNIYLVKRYIWWDVAFFLWTVANTLTIVFIAKGIPAVGGRIDVGRVTTILLIGAVIWAYLGIIFEILTETVQWERWEGTIEYTFMAPLSRPMHLAGMGVFSVVYGGVRLVRRDRDDDGGPTAHLAREGRAARLHRAGHPARRLRGLLPRGRLAR